MLDIDLGQTLVTVLLVFILLPLAVAVLATAALAYAVSQTMVAPALPAIQKDLHTTTTGVTWVLTIYLLTASAPGAGFQGASIDPWEVDT